MLKSIMTLCVSLDEERGVQDQDGSSHPIMNVAVHRHGSGFVEQNGAGLFIFAVSPEIESFRSRIGKDVVVHVVEVWELDGCADQHRDEIGRERHVFLRHLRGVMRERERHTAEIARQVDDCRRRICGRNRLIGDLIAFV